MPGRARSFGLCLSAAVAGTVAIVAGVLSHGFIDELRDIHRFHGLPQDERWLSAQRLAQGGAAGRRTAETWYLSLLAKGEYSRAKDAVRALSLMRSARVVPVLTDALRQWIEGKEPPYPPRFVADRLRELGTVAREAKPELVKLLWVSRTRMVRAGHPSWGDIHQSAVTALECVLGERGMAAGILRNELDHPSWVVRLNAVRELGELGPDAALALDRLTARLEDPQACIREQAATVLGSLGEAGLLALPALRKARDSGDESLEAVVEGAILRLERPELASMDDDE